MKYDVILVGAGPAGYFAAYELSKKDPNLKVALIDRGADIRKRRCPLVEHKIKQCPLNVKGKRECFPACAITNGFGGAGAYSDGKFNITTEFGGWLGEYMDDDQLMDLIKYVDNVNLEFGATEEITDPLTPAVKDIERRAMSVGLKLLRSKVRHLGTEENIKILTRISDYLADKVDMIFEKRVVDLVIENDVRWKPLLSTV